MDYAQRLIYTVYKEFYGKEPNLDKENRKNITLEVQSMVYLLAQYGVRLGYTDFDYNALEEFNMPLSIELQKSVIDKLIGCVNQQSETSVELEAPVKSAIQFVSTIVTDEMRDKKNPIEVVRLISAIFYSEGYIRSEAEKLDVSYNGCTEEEVKSIKRLVKSIVLDQVNGHPAL